MDERYKALFEPLRINHVRLRNRLATPAMGTFAEDSDGLITSEQVSYYEARAKGGFGLVTVEGQYVTNKTDPSKAEEALLGSEQQMKRWALVVEAVHAHGAKCCLQLTAGIGRAMFAVPGGPLPVAPSPVPAACNPEIICRELSTEEVKDIIACFGAAAARAARAECDMIEINGHAGYLIDEFLTEAWNQRTDEFGGNLEKRMHILDELYAAMRPAIGDTPLGLRIGAWHGFEGGREVDETIEICKHAEELGFDFLNIDIGCEEYPDANNPSAYMPAGCTADAAAAVKREVSIPVFNAGSHTPQTALEAIEDGKADVILLGRQSIADPDFPNKLLCGRIDDIRPCIACNRYCLGRVYQGRQVACSVNPQAGCEERFFITKSDVPKRVTVVGGGPAGMEAACVAAKKGHNVVLIEKGEKLGGSLLGSGNLVFKGAERAYLRYLLGQLHELGVVVVLSHDAVPDEPLVAQADEVVVATGARPQVMDIEKADGIAILDSAAAALADPNSLGENVVIAGCSSAGYDLALSLGMQGKCVTIVESREIPIPEEILPMNRSALLAGLGKNGVEIELCSTVERCEQNAAIVTTPEGEKSISCDVLVAAIGVEADDSLVEGIAKHHPHMRIVGDCADPGTLGHAIRSGYFGGWSIT